MPLVYLLLFLLLHLSSSSCEATSRNHRLLLLPAPSPSTTTTLRHDRHDTITMHDASSSDEHDVHAGTMMMRQQGPPPPRLNSKLRGIVEAAMPATMTQQQLGSPPPRPGVKLRDIVEGGNGIPAPAEQESAAAPMIAPSPRGDTGYKEAGGDAVGGETGGSSTSGVIVTDDDQPVDNGIDYAPPKTHPPSHN